MSRCLNSKCATPRSVHFQIGFSVEHIWIRNPEGSCKSKLLLSRKRESKRVATERYRKNAYLHTLLGDVKFVVKHRPPYKLRIVCVRKTKLTEVADSFGYNYDYLANLFRKTTNQKLSNYFIDRKLEMARLLLLENKKKITEIADITNYANVFAFSKAFKHKYGVSPLKYKQQHLPS